MQYRLDLNDRKTWSNVVINLPRFETVGAIISVLCKSKQRLTVSTRKTSIRIQDRHQYPDLSF